VPEPAEFFNSSTIKVSVVILLLNKRRGCR